MNEQAIHIYESIAYVERIRAILPIVPKFFDAKYESVKPSYTAIVVCTSRYMSYSIHIPSLVNAIQTVIIVVGVTNHF